MNALGKHLLLELKDCNKEMLYSGQMKFQSIEIICCGSFGKCLVLDGKIQSSEVDEFILPRGIG